MKKIFALLFATMFFLSACDSGKDAEQPAPEPAIEETQPEPAVVEPVAEEPPAEEEAKPELVEESAAEVVEEAVAIKLPEPETAQVLREWKYKEGTHYRRLVPTQPTVGGADKIEVAEVFWYGCGHCFDFESYINKWKQDLPANVRFVRIPALWNPLVALHGRLYYTEEVLAKNGALANPEEFRAAVFQEYHRRGNRLTSEGAIQKFFERFGVDAETFGKTWKSFEVDQKLRVAQDLARRYGITGVPAIVVNGKYRLGAAEVGSYPGLLEAVDELVEKESIR
ncbi:MAG TPA: thiol:disulfide interchange protein DsbA/DsbL [Woeseiaceae bacterium]